MRIRVLAFASASDTLGAGELEMELPAGSRVADLRSRLEASHPELAALWPRLAVAVDGEVVSAGAELAEGAEVALLPPVSGGSGASGPPGVAEGVRAELAEAPIDVARVAAAVSAPSRGAVLLFLGTVRDSHRGRRVERLTYSAYRAMAEERLLRIVDELEAGGEDLALAIVHRLGEVAVGEASVVIAAASPHRAAAYEASRQALERLKHEVPIWKREHYGEGESAWREEESLAGASRRRRT
jgi:molybdopterin synthase catalytic subunit